jgi:DNA-binding Lrp family transcriptional regulator
MLKIVVADMAAYETLLSTRLLQVPAIRAVNTTFVLRARKYTTMLPLD